jgi:hypothetical protein
MMAALLRCCRAAGPNFLPVPQVSLGRLPPGLAALLVDPLLLLPPSTFGPPFAREDLAREDLAGASATRPAAALAAVPPFPDMAAPAWPPSAPATAVTVRSLPQPVTATAVVPADRRRPDAAPAARSAGVTAPSGTAAPRQAAELIPLRRPAAPDPANSLSTTARPLHDDPPLPLPLPASALACAQPPLRGGAASPAPSSQPAARLPTAQTPAKLTETTAASYPDNPAPLRLTRAAGRLATVLADNLARPTSLGALPSAAQPVAAAPPPHALSHPQAEATADTRGKTSPILGEALEPAEMRHRAEASGLTPDMVEALLDALTDRLQFEFLRTYGTVR